MRAFLIPKSPVRLSRAQTLAPPEPQMGAGTPSLGRFKSSSVRLSGNPCSAHGKQVRLLVGLFVVVRHQPRIACSGTPLLACPKPE